MGYRLYHEITDNAPGWWSTEMRFTAAVIAQDANDQTRKSQIQQDRLLQKTGLSLPALKRALGKLAAAGCDFRVRIGTDKNGKPVYTRPGHAMDYVVPRVEWGSHTSPITPNNGAHIPNPIIEPQTPRMGLTCEPPTPIDPLVTSTGTRVQRPQARPDTGTSAGEAGNVAIMEDWKADHPEVTESMRHARIALQEIPESVWDVQVPELASR